MYRTLSSKNLDQCCCCSDPPTMQHKTPSQTGNYTCPMATNLTYPYGNSNGQYFIQFLSLLTINPMTICPLPLQENVRPTLTGTLGCRDTSTSRRENQVRNVYNTKLYISRRNSWRVYYLIWYIGIINWSL